MLDIRQIEWRDDLILSRDIPIAGDRTAFYTRVRAGEFVAVRRGVYMRTSLWQSLDIDERYLARVRAVVAFDNHDPVVADVSAASLWRLPWIGRYPHAVHLMVDAAAGGRSSSTVIRHTVGVPDSITWMEGIRVTSLARTVVDVARTCTFEQGVAIADAALHRTKVPLNGVPAALITKEDLFAELAKTPISRSTAKARTVVDFSDGDAESPGESVSRVNIALAGLTSPVLQQELRGASGKDWRVDFWWPQFNLIGESDGKGKYTDPRYLRGRTPQQAIYDEKLREDDLRAIGHGFSRWPWETGSSMPALRAHLIAAGVR